MEEEKIESWKEETSASELKQMRKAIETNILTGKNLDEKDFLKNPAGEFGEIEASKIEIEQFEQNRNRLILLAKQIKTFEELTELDQKLAQGPSKWSEDQLKVFREMDYKKEEEFRKLAAETGIDNVDVLYSEKEKLLNTLKMSAPDEKSRLKRFELN